MNTNFDLDKSIFQFIGKNGVSDFSIKNSLEGAIVLGANGSGKTSSVGKKILSSYMSMGFGGLILTVKTDEKDAIVEYCKRSSRLDDLIVLENDGNHYFDFLEYEGKHRPGGISITANIVQLLKTVLTASEEKKGSSNQDPFWQDSLDIFLYNVIDLCLLAYDKISVKLIYDIALTTPKIGRPTKEKAKYGTYTHAFTTAQNKILSKIDIDDELRMIDDSDELEERVLDKIPDAALLRSIDHFFVETFMHIGEKTRNTIELSFLGFLFQLTKDPINSLLCRKTTFTPEDCLEGKIILINMPVKIYGQIGKDIQTMLKYIFQVAFERRDVTKNDRILFIYADEMQEFFHSHDQAFQSTARSSRVATVYMSQNLHGLFCNMGGNKSEHRVKGFLATLNTKFFLANSDIETNAYASELIGKAYFEDVSVSKSIGSNDLSNSESKRVQLESLVRPEIFHSLKTGSAENNFQVEAYVHRLGKPFENGHNHKKLVFNQKI